MMKTFLLILVLCGPVLAQQMKGPLYPGLPGDTSTPREREIVKCFHDAPWVDDGTLERCLHRMLERLHPDTNPPKE
jgi:hypothetical protein